MIIVFAGASLFGYLLVAITPRTIQEEPPSPQQKSIASLGTWAVTRASVRVQPGMLRPVSHLQAARGIAALLHQAALRSLEGLLSSDAKAIRHHLS